MMRRRLAVLLALLALPVAAAAGAGCQLALALAVDVSGSVDSAEYRQQMDGLAAALRDQQVAEGLVGADAAVMLVQWSGASRQEETIPWQRTQSLAAVARLATRVARAPRRWRNYSTALGEALAVTLAAFADAPRCARRVIDVSGDGFSNEGRAPSTVLAALDAAGVTVNGLAIEGSTADLTGYYLQNVIHGAGAFVMTAKGFQDYPDAIRRKLLREVTLMVARAR